MTLCIYYPTSSNYRELSRRGDLRLFHSLSPLRAKAPFCVGYANRDGTALLGAFGAEQEAREYLDGDAPAEHARRLERIF